MFRPGRVLGVELFVFVFKVQIVIVVDMYSRSRFYPTSPASELAEALEGELYTMAQLKADGVLEKVRTELELGRGR